MQTYKLILPEHLNHAGFLFGGNLLKWVDEAGYTAARLDYPDCEFVTVALNHVVFKKRVALGSILRFDVTSAHTGNTSTDYSVIVHRSGNTASPSEIIFTTTITLVHVDAQGTKQPLPKSNS
jgi:acyl-CoA hydrolase